MEELLPQVIHGALPPHESDKFYVMEKTILNQKESRMTFLNYKPILSVINWGSLATTIAAILHWIPIGFGVIGSFFWLLVAYYNFRKSRNEFRESAFRV